MERHWPAHSSEHTNLTPAFNLSETSAWDRPSHCSDSPGPSTQGLCSHPHQEKRTWKSSVHLCRRGQPIYTHAGEGGRHGGRGDSPVLIVDKTPKFKEMTREGMGKRIWKWKSRERKRPGEKNLWVQTSEIGINPPGRSCCEWESEVMYV